MNSLKDKELVNHKRELNQLVSCKYSKIRSRIASFLSDYTDSYAEQLLCDLLFDKNWIVRSNALHALEEIGTKYSIKYVMKASEKEKFEINIPFYISCLTYSFMRIL